MQVSNINIGEWCGTYKIFGMTLVKAPFLHNNFEKHVFENIMENGAFALLEHFQNSIRPNAPFSIVFSKVFKT